MVRRQRRRKACADAPSYAGAGAQGTGTAASSQPRDLVAARAGSPFTWLRERANRDHDDAVADLWPFGRSRRGEADGEGVCRDGGATWRSHASDSGTHQARLTLQIDDPDRAGEIYFRTLEIGQQTGDAAVQARSHNNLGNIAIRRNDWQKARTSFRNAIALARGSGIPDIWGVAALNLGVTHHRTGEYDRARELLGEALALVAAVKNSEIQLYALYNLAHIEWENDRWESAAELYEATASLAQRIGASDVQIGAIAAVGLCHLEGNNVEKAREASEQIQELLKKRSDWFQGREFAVALSVALLVADGESADAIDQYEKAASFAESSDLYTAAWLTAICGQTLLPHAPKQMRTWIERFRSHVEEFGYAGIAKRFNELVAG